jgi:hypothetical protein
MVCIKVPDLMGNEGLEGFSGRGLGSSLRGRWPKVSNALGFLGSIITPLLILPPLDFSLKERRCFQVIAERSNLMDRSSWVSKA